MPGTSRSGGTIGQPRVFIDHSGYDLLNIGDMAMLKATVTRLRDRWPRARLQIVTTSRERLAALCPGTDPVTLVADRGPAGWLPDRVRGGLGLRYKAAMAARPAAAWRLIPGAGQLLDAVRLRTLPVKNPEQMVKINIDHRNGASGNFTTRYPELTYGQWEKIRAQQQAFSSVFAWGPNLFNISPGGEVHNVQGLWVSGEFFETLGVEPALGRLLTPADDRPNCNSTGAVISHSFWKHQYAGENSVIGRTLTISRHPFQIIGVTRARRGYAAATSLNLPRIEKARQFLRPRACSPVIVRIHGRLLGRLQAHALETGAFGPRFKPVPDAVAAVEAVAEGFGVADEVAGTLGERLPTSEQRL